VEDGERTPLAQAIIAAATARKIAVAPVTDFDSPTGKGVVGTVENRHLVLGKTPPS